MKHRITIILVCMLIIFLFTCSVFAQEKKVATASSGLFKEIAAQDSLMFVAFNTQDLAMMKTFFAPTLEWFQDNVGLIGFDTVFMNFENNFKKPNKLKRNLVKNTMEVYPIKNYGAIETGIHQIRHMEDGREIVGTFKFLMIWQKQANNKWQITKMVSYDH